MLPPHLRHRDLNRIRDLSRRRMRPMRTIHQPAQLLTQIAAQPTVNRRPVHPDTGSNLGDIRTGQHRTHRVQTLLDNRQDNQSQSRPPRSKTSRGDVGHRVPKQTAVADHLANACRTSVDGGQCYLLPLRENFLYAIKPAWRAAASGGRPRAGRTTRISAPLALRRRRLLSFGEPRGDQCPLTAAKDLEVQHLTVSEREDHAKPPSRP